MHAPMNIRGILLHLVHHIIIMQNFLFHYMYIGLRINRREHHSQLNEIIKEDLLWHNVYKQGLEPAQHEIPG